MFVLNKSIVITSLALSCPALLYYYMSNLQQKINKYEENFESLNKKYGELSKNYIELMKKLNFNYDNLLLNITENITDELDEPLIF